MRNGHLAGQQGQKTDQDPPGEVTPPHATPTPPRTAQWSGWSVGSGLAWLGGAFSPLRFSVFVWKTGIM